MDCGGDDDVDHVRADRKDTVTGCGPEDKVKQKGRTKGDDDTPGRRGKGKGGPRRA